ncbi:MAG: restriction endonuclease [Ignavibacteria bacterium]|nr:restriction endonuclease [Ignavibacteria bacterium]
MLGTIFHFPPDLFELLVQVIPLLNKSKQSVLDFFEGSGISTNIFKDVIHKVRFDKNSISKYEIARQILLRINQDNDKYLRERRELLKRVIEFEAYSSCWPSDQYKAKGFVSEIQKIVGIKDSFTRINKEREKEAQQRIEENKKRLEVISKKKEDIRKVKLDFYSLFGESNHQLRGKKLESVLNSLFRAYNILIKEDFKRNGSNDEGILEQIDGIIEINNKIFFVEMKWTKDKISSDSIFAHLGRVYHRSAAQGIYISASGYSASGLEASRDAIIKGTLLVLFDLEEFVKILENEIDLKEYIDKKIETAVIHKLPYQKFTP